jgi:uncharacterized membrane protein YraQ (UPF0718 family)
MLLFDHAGPRQIVGIYAELSRIPPMRGFGLQGHGVPRTMQIAQFRRPSAPMPARRRRKPFDWSTAVVVLISAVSGVTVYLGKGPEQFFSIFRSDVFLFGNMMPKMLAGCLIGGFVTLLLPREMVARFVGAESGLIGLLIASAVGAVLPGGPFTIYPVAGAFLGIGADAGTAIAFITSWMLLGYNRALVWELPFFGPDFVLWRIVVSLPLPFLAGILGRVAVRALALRMESTP